MHFAKAATLRADSIAQILLRLAQSEDQDIAVRRSENVENVYRMPVQELAHACLERSRSLETVRESQHLEPWKQILRCCNCDMNKESLGHRLQLMNPR